MKIIKVIILFLIITSGLYLGACFLFPQNYKLEKSLIINSPSDLVYEQVLFFENWKNWNKFLTGNNQFHTIASAEDGKEKSYLRWKNKKGEEGKILILKIDDLKKIEYQIFIEKPKPIFVNGYISLEPELNKTKVTFHFEGSNPFYKRIFNFFVERHYENVLTKNLEQLNVISENEYRILKEEYFGYKIKESEFGEKNVGYIRKTIKYEELNDFFNKNFDKIKKEAKNCNIKITGKNLSLFYKPDDINRVYNVAAAVPIEGDSTLGEDFGMMKFEKQKAIFLNYYGGNFGIYKAEQALQNFSINNKLKIKKPIIREHFVGKEQITDSNKWHTKIWFLIN